MSYRLRMSDEIRAWLSDLRRAEPEVAMCVGRALTALLEAGENLGPPLVAPLAGGLTPGELANALNGAYELMVERVRALRRAAAAAGADSFQEEARELQAEADALRARKEVLNARGVAAELMLEIDGADTEAAEQLAEVTTQMRRELAGADDLGRGLMELRPGALDDGDVLIFFAVEPAGVALLISVLEGSGAIAEQSGRAMAVSVEVLRRVRAGRDPDASAWEFPDKEAFLREFFADSAGEMAAEAAALAAGYRAPSTLPRQSGLPASAPRDLER